MAKAAKTAVAAALVTASNSCVEGICVVNAAAGR
jgi:NCAIR mutase (PurE)-related protein